MVRGVGPAAPAAKARARGATGHAETTEAAERSPTACEATQASSSAQRSNRHTGAPTKHATAIARYEGTLSARRSQIDEDDSLGRSTHGRGVSAVISRAQRAGVSELAHERHDGRERDARAAMDRIARGSRPDGQGAQRSPWPLSAPPCQPLALDHGGGIGRLQAWNRPPRAHEGGGGACPPPRPTPHPAAIAHAEVGSSGGDAASGSGRGWRAARHEK